MIIDKLKTQLDDAKQRFNTAKQELENLRQEIAETLCPIKIGERVTILDDGKEYEGVVEYINYATPPEELLGPVVGAETGWVAGGHRINKSTGLIGKWSFGINSLESELIEDKWLLKEQGLDKFLPFI